MRPEIRTESRRVSRVETTSRRVANALAGLRFPAMRWQLIAEADYYGADALTRDELTELPIQSYPDLAAVISTLAAIRPRRRPLQLAQRPTQVRRPPAIPTQNTPALEVIGRMPDQRRAAGAAANPFPSRLRGTS